MDGVNQVVVDSAMRRFFQQYAERKAAQATRQATMHITRENALLRVSKLWETRKTSALAQLDRAEALLLGVNDPERVAENAAQHNQSAVVWSNGNPSVWLNFAITNQETDFYVPDGTAGARELEKAIDDALSDVLAQSQRPNPLCIRMRDVRLHLTQTGRAYHLETSLDLEPHELELESREHMRSWETHLAEYARILKMASAAMNGSARPQWLQWLEKKNPFIDPPTLAFEQSDVDIRRLPAKTDYVFLQHAQNAGMEETGAIINQIDLSSDNEKYFLGTHATDAAAVYFEANTLSKFSGFVSTAFEADGRVLFAAIDKELFKQSCKVYPDQDLLRLILASSYYDSTLVTKLVVRARTEHGPETFCYALVVDKSGEKRIALQPRPAFFAAKQMVETTLRGYDNVINASDRFHSAENTQKASLLHAAGVIIEYQERSTQFADARGLKLAKRKLRQLSNILARVTP
ncbi:MAG: hypothetical protein CL678_01230 [Bdellovibrionaceae bacterium]|nr:hypothetical protein [Pseudobdellovibrionaceae bacterium]|tara:strand:- start:2068 stop:3459 length:1392 start_codon:yes stop_codon:yes gene_type:complete